MAKPTDQWTKGHSDTPTPTGSLWSNSFPKVGGNAPANGGKK